MCSPARCTEGPQEASVVSPLGQRVRHCGQIRTDSDSPHLDGSWGPGFPQSQPDARQHARLEPFWAYPLTAQNSSRMKQQRLRIGTDCCRAERLCQPSPEHDLFSQVTMRKSRDSLDLWGGRNGMIAAGQQRPCQLNLALCESSCEHAFVPRLPSLDASRPASGRTSDASLP